MGAVQLVYCASGNREFAAAALAAGWLYGAKLPTSAGNVTQALWFADQDWHLPDRGAYMAALARYRPVFATVLDWEYEEQLPEVLSWAEEASQHTCEGVIIIPKVPGGILSLPRRVGGKRVVLGYSVPTSYGASPLGLWEYRGWPVHLLGGSPQRQLETYRYLSLAGEVVSADGNMSAQQARRGRTWQRASGAKGHWWQLRDLGDARPEGVPLECFRRSLVEIRAAWENMG